MAEMLKNDVPADATAEINGHALQSIDRNSAEYKALVEEQVRISLQRTQIESAHRILGPLYRRG